MLKQSLIKFGDTLDVALLIRIDQRSDEPEWNFCGMSCCIANHWMGSIEQVSMRGLIKRNVSDIAQGNYSETQHFLPEDPRIDNKATYTIFYPRTINEAIAAFLEYVEGKKGAPGYLGSSYAGASEIGEEHRLHLECEGMDASPYDLFTAVSGETLRIYALHQENHLLSFIHDTKINDFITVFKEAENFLK